MTSNVGAQFIDKSTIGIGFQTGVVGGEHAHHYKKIRDMVTDAMKKTFRPEFLNRIDETVVFQQLTREEIRKIVDIMSADLQSRIKSQGMELRISDECKDYIAKDGYNPTYGARPLRRSIQRLLEDALAEQVLLGNFKEGDIIETDLDGDTITFKKSGKKPAASKKEEVAAAGAGVGNGSSSGGRKSGDDKSAASKS